MERKERGRTGRTGRKKEKEEVEEVDLQRWRKKEEGKHQPVKRTIKHEKKKKKK